MAALKNVRLRGSTLIETLIASVIFLCVFVISLETLSRLTVRKNDSAILVEADYRAGQCRREFTSGGHEPGAYMREYPWGNITIILKPYRHYASLRELTITADIKNDAKRLEYRYIFEDDEK